MKKSLTQATARKAPSATVESNVKTLTDRLSKATAFITSNQGDILKAPVAEMSKELLVASFCVLRRMGNAINRRLGQVQPKVQELFKTFPEVQRGQPGHEISAGPFTVKLANKAMNSKVMDGNVVRDVLRSKRIPLKSVQVELPEPVMSQDKLAILVQEGKLSQAEYDSCFKAAPPSLELRVDVPDLLDDVIQNRLLGGIRDGK